jgi:hypothetical protein
MLVRVWLARHQNVMFGAKLTASRQANTVAQNGGLARSIVVRRGYGA